MLCNANMQDRAVFAMWSLKVSCSLKITPRFLTELDGVVVEEPSWMVISCCRVGVAGKTRSSVFARLSCSLSSMQRCPAGSLRSVQLPLDYQVEMRDTAVCHHHSNGRRNHVPV